MQLMFDFFAELDKAPKVDFKVGDLLNREDVKRHLGRELKFRELKDMVAQKVIISTSGSNNYQVVEICGYHEMCDQLYKRIKELPEKWSWYGDYINHYTYWMMHPEAKDCYETYHYCDRVRYSRNPKRPHNGECSLSEMYCTTCRWESIGKETFHELV